MKQLLWTIIMSATLFSGVAQAGIIGISMANSDTFLTVLRNGIVAYAQGKKQELSVENANIVKGAIVVGAAIADQYRRRS